MLGTACRDKLNVNGTPPGLDDWVYFRPPGKCVHVDPHDDTHEMNETIIPLVYVFQIPTPRNGKFLNYSQWQHRSNGVLQIEVMYHSYIVVSPITKLTIDARLAYRNKGDPEDEWKHYASSIVERNLECTIDNALEEYNYNCSTLSLFELGSVFHDYYLLNIRLPNDPLKRTNQDLRYITDLYVTVINQNGGFTKVWVSLKTVSFSITLLVLRWHWRRIHSLSR
ncbi:protein wntless-like [Trichogramma pretiosum]|uniref:protein wntless-like n=1 Tax=Trichogramma pretiosum TaxID=7493 RepID=UPI000C71C2E7|nr:protein wntless-like [Trichogramma pretiosum]XP_023316037.1 protein wntless-like [Trichogramma pretiosum]